MPPQDIFKIQGVSGAFWCDFGTYELRAQLTSAHTQTARASRSNPERARAFIRAPPSVPKMHVMRWAYTYLRTAVAQVSSFKRPLIQGALPPFFKF